MSRVAGAPISWGVCEVPDWGWQMPAERVLKEMRALGLEATELGPPGFLPLEPEALKARLDAAQLRLVAGFLAVELPGKGHSVLTEQRDEASVQRVLAFFRERLQS